MEEVPIFGSDSVRWIEVSVPPSNANITSSHYHDDIDGATLASTSFAPLTEDRASCSVIGDPPLYLIWRIHKTVPYALELLQLSADEEFPTVGLRINFSHALSPFAFIFKDQISSTVGKVCSLYALTTSGVAYLLKLSNISAYSSCSIFPRDDVVDFNIPAYSNHGPITSVAALPGCLVVGRWDGSVACFQLGRLHQTASGFVHELRDDSAIGRLWGLVSRGRIVGAIQDLVISIVHDKKLLIVLHADGIVRVWDLLCHSRIFSHNMAVPTLEGASFLRLWVGEADCGSGIISLAVLYRRAEDVSIDMINVYGLHCSFEDKMTLSLDSTMQNIPLEEGKCVDVKLTSDEIWILKDNGFVHRKLCHTNVAMEEEHYYALQEEFVADQLFQSSEHCSDDLLLITRSIFSSVKEQILPFVSSIFLRRLFLPGVHHTVVLRATLSDYNKHWTDSEFDSLSIDGLKKEILSLVEHEGVFESSASVFYWWKNFGSRYFHYWCKNNAPYGLLVQSSAGVVGLIRKNSVSLFRGLENIELLFYGSSDELGDLVSSGLDLSHDEHEILVDVLRCITRISQQLGKSASAVFYESFIGTPIVSSEEIVPRLLKILEMGYNSSVTLLNVSDLGADIAWEKEQVDHKSLRKFSIDMLLSLLALYERATSWAKVLNVIESYLQFLVPQKIIQNVDGETLFNVDSSILIQATSQIARVMFESALHILLFVNYMVNISSQINMLQDDIYRIQLELVPMIQEIVFEWLIILFFGTTPSESSSMEDFSSQLSSLQIDSNISKRSWNKKLGKSDFTLAFVLLLNSDSYFGEQNHFSLRSLPNPQIVISLVRNFISWIIWGKTGKESSSFLRRATELSLILLRNGQFNAVEYLLTIVEANSQREKVFQSIQGAGGDWCLLQHLLGCCLLTQAQRGFCGILKERKIWEAVRCFFSASSGEGAFEALQSLSDEAGLSHLSFRGTPDVRLSAAAWKLHYYEWAMQIFEQYNISEGACQFALAALEKVDEALTQKDDSCARDPFNESATTIKGRLWANVFKLTLDLNVLNDAYCAIISNPDEESKYICLRRFIIVLYERGGIKILCDGQLPFIGLTEKIERELAWKAERSDVFSKPNPYKLLYAFEMHRHNWRRAASYMYQYSARLRTESVFKDYQHASLALQERLNGLSAVVNALHLVHPAYAWIDPLPVGISLRNKHYPSKKARKAVTEQSCSDDQPQRPRSYIDIEKLQNEFVLTSAQYLLSLANIKWIYSGIEKPPSELIDLLVQTNLYDMAFTVILKFWKGSGLKRELERVFTAMAIKCCPSRAGSLWVGSHSLLLTSSEDEVVVHGSPDVTATIPNSKASGQWETLETYLERYKVIHARLPVIVAETLLRTDPQVELPLWLVHMFKGGQREGLGMTGQESSTVSLFRLYVDYHRYTEATNLLLECIDSFASIRPAGIVNRKRPFAVWFPYTIMERLWCHLEEMNSLGHMVDQCDKLKKLLHAALLNHLKLLKLDSDDAVSSAVG